jgi:hypothetical protein
MTSYHLYPGSINKNAYDMDYRGVTCESSDICLCLLRKLALILILGTDATSFAVGAMITKILEKFIPDDSRA